MDYEYRDELSRVIGKLIRQLEHKRNQYVDDTLQGTGLRGTMYRYLLFLDRHPGSSQDLMADHFRADKGNIARDARKLEELGLIVRRQNQDNRRQYQVFLTAKGEALLPRIRQTLAAWNAALVSGINQEQELELIRLLEQMRDNTTSLL